MLVAMDFLCPGGVLHCLRLVERRPALRHGLVLVPLVPLLLVLRADPNVQSAWHAVLLELYPNHGLALAVPRLCRVPAASVLLLAAPLAASVPSAEPCLAAAPRSIH